MADPFVGVVDTGDLPLANFPHFNQGLTLADAVACLQVVCGSAKLGGLVVTEVNPDHDPDGTQLGRLVDGLAAALALQELIDRLRTVPGVQATMTTLALSSLHGTEEPS